LLGGFQCVYQLLPVVRHILILVRNHGLCLCNQLLQHRLVALCQAKTPNAHQQVIPCCVHFFLSRIRVIQYCFGFAQHLLKVCLCTVCHTFGAQCQCIIICLLQQGLVGRFLNSFSYNNSCNGLHIGTSHCTLYHNCTGL